MTLMGHIMSCNSIGIFAILWASHLLRSSVHAHSTLQLMFHCEELATPNGFMYQVPQDRIPVGNLRDCEHGWYFPNGTFIVDSTIPGENLEFVVHVKPENLTVTSCVNLQWQLDCDVIRFYLIVNYTVRLKTTQTTLPEKNTSPGDNEGACSASWIIAVSVGIGIIGLIILAVTIRLCWKKAYKKVKVQSSLPADDGSNNHSEVWNE